MKENIPASSDQAEVDSRVDLPAEIESVQSPTSVPITPLSKRINFLRFAGQILLSILGVALVAAAVYFIGRGLFPRGQVKPVASAISTPTLAQGLPALPDFSSMEDQVVSGLTRIAQLKTTLPAHPRYDVTQYEVVSGDSVFAIAEKFGLAPETIMWANYETLRDNPTLQPGMILNILPVDGVLYRWTNGDGLYRIADFYGVPAETILNFPGNDLDPAKIGDIAFPSIPEGTMIIVPGGKRTYISWTAPGITRDNPGVARIMGPGACDGVFSGGPIAGDPPYAWPALWRDISGYDYTPNTNHFGIDIAGRTGHPITSIANGVVVYAGWNYGGYGIVAVVDHGNGYQSIYAHLSVINVQCGTWVYTGTQLGLMGSTGRSTGPHLHFEIQNDELGRVNPWNYLSR